MKIDDEILDDSYGAERLLYDGELKAEALYVLGIGLGFLRKERGRLARIAIARRAPPIETMKGTSEDGEPIFIKTFSAKSEAKMAEMVMRLHTVILHGRKLYEFTKGELVAEINKEKNQRDGLSEKIAFYEGLVAPMTDDDQVVGPFWEKRSRDRKAA